MKNPTQIEFAKVVVQPSAGPQGLPILILRFPHGSVSIDLNSYKRGRIETLERSARRAAATIRKEGVLNNGE